jgi:hypothetical protein
MAIADLKKDFTNTLNRNGSVFIRAYNGGTPEFVNMGRVKGSSVEHDTVDSEMDQDGRTSTQLLELTASFTLQQGSNLELELVPDLAQPDTSQGTVYDNGHVIYFAGTNQLSTSTVNGNTTTDADGDPIPDYSALSSDDPDGLVFINVLLNPGPSFDLSGGENVIPVEFSARFPPSVYSSHNDTAATDGNHVVVSPK